MRRGQGEGTGILPRELRFAAKWLYELCFWFSMPDETVATRPPWLDSSLPGVHAGAFLYFVAQFYSL